MEPRTTSSQLWSPYLRVVDEFFREIDRRWTGRATDRIILNIIGSGALMLQAKYERGTRDRLASRRRLRRATRSGARMPSPRHETRAWSRSWFGVAPARPGS